MVSSTSKDILTPRRRGFEEPWGLPFPLSVTKRPCLVSQKTTLVVLEFLGGRQETRGRVVDADLHRCLPGAGRYSPKKKQDLV